MRYRPYERHLFDPGPCPRCGVAGAFTVDWVDVRCCLDKMEDWAVPGEVKCLACSANDDQVSR